MASKNSRGVLDWFRTWAQGRLTVIGRTDIASNIDLPFNNHNRVTTTLSYVLGVEADVWVLYDPSWESFWPLAGDGVNTSWDLDMPANVRADWDEMWVDPDLNIRTLLKATVRMVGMVELANAVGG